MLFFRFFQFYNRSSLRSKKKKISMVMNLPFNSIIDLHISSDLYASIRDCFTFNSIIDLLSACLIPSNSRPV